MSKILFICLAVMAIISTTFAQDCGVNEVFTTCGSACEPSCASPRDTACTMQCVIGCQCKDGFLRNSQGSCVLQRDC